MSGASIGFEAMLLDWSESAKGGCKVVLQLASDEDLAHFKAMSLPSGRGKDRICGQRLMVGVARIADDETRAPVDEKPKGGPLARLAATWCNDETFWTWLAEMYPDAWGPAMKKADTEAEIAVLCLYEVCGIASRVELDNDEAAASRFHMLVREPFSLHLRETA